MSPNENYMKTPKSKFNSKKSGNLKKEVVIDKNKISSFYNKNNNIKNKKAEIKKNKYK